MKLMKKKVLVTGGAGFIGSHLSERLLKEGASVRILDNFSTGDKRNLNNVFHDIEIIEGDIRNRDIVKKSLKNVDIVFHEAAQINPAKAVKDPLFDFEVNVVGTINLLFEALNQNVQKFIMASTNVYGNAEEERMHESFSTLFKKNSLLSPYAAAKVSAEAYLKVANDELGLPTVRLRYTNVYGPRQLAKSESGVVAIFVKNAMRKKPITIFGDGSRKRDFVYIDDVVEANILASECEKANGDVFNVGTGIETSVKELATLIIDITGENIPIIYGPERAADFLRVKADLTHINSILGYTPKVFLKEGLIKYIDWCTKNQDRL